MTISRRKFFEEIMAAGVAAVIVHQDAQAQSNIVVQPLTVNKSQAEDAAKKHPGNSESVLSDMNKLQTDVSKAASGAAAAGVGAAGTVAGQTGRLGGAVQGAANIGRRLGFGGGANNRGADWYIQDEVATSSLNGTIPVILVYGDAATANSLKEILTREGGLPPTIVMRFVNPRDRSNRDFDDHLADKGGRIIVWPAGAAIEKPAAVLTQIEAAANGRLATALMPPAPAQEPVPEPVPEPPQQ